MSRRRTKIFRTATVTAVVLLALAGSVGRLGTGSLSAFGVGDISAICPLGWLETALASRTFLPRAFAAFLAIAGLTVLLGRAFCSWICPLPLARRLFLGKEEKNAPARRSFSPALPVLGLSLASSAAFGFPVFCLVCPVGLLFATLFALLRLLQFHEPTLDLVVFPGVILLELVFLKKWCGRWCPMGALFRLFSRFNRRLVPVVDAGLCLKSRQADCRVCRDACAFGVDPVRVADPRKRGACTKCRECADNCPARAIRFPWRKRSA